MDDHSKTRAQETDVSAPPLDASVLPGSGVPSIDDNGDDLAVGDPPTAAPSTLSAIAAKTAPVALGSIDNSNDDDNNDNDNNKSNNANQTSEVVCLTGGCDGGGGGVAGVGGDDVLVGESGDGGDGELFLPTSGEGDVVPVGIKVGEESVIAAVGGEQREVGCGEDDRVVESRSIDLETGMQVVGGEGIDSADSGGREKPLEIVGEAVAGEVGAVGADGEEGTEPAFPVDGWVVDGGLGLEQLRLVEEAENGFAGLGGEGQGFDAILKDEKAGERVRNRESGQREEGAENEMDNDSLFDDFGEESPAEPQIKEKMEGGVIDNLSGDVAEDSTARSQAGRRMEDAIGTSEDDLLEVRVENDDSTEKDQLISKTPIEEVTKIPSPKKAMDRNNDMEAAKDIEERKGESRKKAATAFEQIQCASNEKASPPNNGPSPKNQSALQKDTEDKQAAENREAEAKMEAAREWHRAQLRGNEKANGKNSLANKHSSLRTDSAPKNDIEDNQEAEAKMEAAREFHRRQLESDDEDNLFVNKFTPKTNKYRAPTNTTKTQPSKQKETTLIDLAARQGDHSRKSSDSSSSVEIINSRGIKKPILEKPTLQKPTAEPEKSQRQADPAASKVTNDTKENNTFRKSILKKPTSYRTAEQNTHTPTISHQNPNSRSTIKEHPKKNNTTTSSPTASSPKFNNKNQTPPPKPKFVHWKDIKEKSPSQRYGHDVNRPLGPDDGSMDAFIITETKPDSKPTLLKPAPLKSVRSRDIPKDVFIPQRKGDDRRREQEQQRLRQEQRWQKGARKDTEQQKRGDRQRQYYEPQRGEGQELDSGKTRAAPVAHMYSAPTVSRSGSGQYRDDRKHPQRSWNDSYSARANSASTASETSQRGPKRAEHLLESDAAPRRSASKALNTRMEEPQHGGVGAWSKQPGYTDRNTARMLPSTQVASARNSHNTTRFTDNFRSTSSSPNASSSSSPVNVPSEAYTSKNHTTMVKTGITAPRRKPPPSSRSHQRLNSGKGGGVEKNPTLPKPVLNRNQKRVLSDIPADTLFQPNQILTKGEDERRKRQKVEKKQERTENVMDEVVRPSGHKRQRFDDVVERAVKRQKNGEEMADGQEVWNSESSNNQEQTGEAVCLRVEVPVVQREQTPQGQEKEVLEVADSQERVLLESKEVLATTEEHFEPPSLEEEGKNEPPGDTPEPVITLTEPSEGVQNKSSHKDVQAQSSSHISSPTLTPPEHPKTSRKTVSPAMLAALQSATSSETSPERTSPSPCANDEDLSNQLSPQTLAATARKWSESQSEKDFAAVSGDILYRYTVVRQDYGPKVTPEGEAIETEIGTYFTLDEANEQALWGSGRKRTVPARRRRKRKGRGEEEELQEQEEGFGSEISVVTDDCGCRTFTIVDRLGESVCVKVEKTAAPQTEPMPFIPRDGWILPRRVYVVMQCYIPASLLAGNVEEGSEDVETMMAKDLDIRTMEVNTALYLANKRAGETTVRLQTRHLGRKTVDDIVAKSDLEMAMRGHLVELDEKGELFERTVVLEDGSMIRIWVAAVVVQGPRN